MSANLAGQARARGICDSAAPALPDKKGKQADMENFSGERNFDNWATNAERFYEQGSRNEIEFHFSRLLILAARRWTIFIDDAIRGQTGHSRANWQTLFSIAFSDGPIATLDLSERMAIQWPTLIRSLKELEARGLIRRWTNPDDRRSRLIEITAEGRQALDEVQAVLDPTRHELFAIYSDDELRLGTDLLKRLFDAID